MTREEIFSEYTIRNFTICDPGKFEGESAYAPYFWDEACDGSEELLADMESHGEFVALLDVTSEDRAAFPEIDSDTVAMLIRESNEGFVSISELTPADVDFVQSEYAFPNTCSECGGSLSTDCETGRPYCEPCGLDY
jgi:hypothetical protein